MSNSLTRKRVKLKGKEEIRCIFNYSLDYIEVGVACSNMITITYLEFKGLELSTKLLRLYYKLISNESDIKKVETLLRIKISNNGITDLKGNSIIKVKL